VTLRLVYRPKALEEVAEAAQWYEERRIGLSAEFFAALDAAVASVQNGPLLYPMISRGMRRAVLRRFPYSLIFSVPGDEIVVLGCVHWRQSPRRWLEVEFVTASGRTLALTTLPAMGMREVRDDDLLPVRSAPRPAA